MSLSTLRARVPLVSLASLTDDNLLVILRHLSVPQLLELLFLSRRFNFLIVQYIFPRYRTIAIPRLRYKPMDVEQPVFFSRYFRAYTTFNKTQSSFFQPNHYLRYAEYRHGQLYRSRPNSFPIHLPHLFPRLESFTFSYKLQDQIQLLSDEETLINRLLSGFLRSTWFRTLVSLELQVIQTALPQSSETFYSQLNQLPSLRHLFLRFLSPGGTQMRIMPDSMPVLRQLVSFSLHTYEAVNAATLLGQLGPDLAYLSLLYVTCREQDFLAFLTGKPSYKATLRTLELLLLDETFHSPHVSSLARLCPSLEKLSTISYVYGDLFSFFEGISRLSRLQEMGSQRVTISQLRALQDYPRFSLPRVTSLRRLGLRIDCADNDFQAAELFDGHLVLLGAILCAVECFEILFIHSPSDGNSNVTLSEQLVVKMKEHFPNARICRGNYHSMRQRPA